MLEQLGIFEIESLSPINRRLLADRYRIGSFAASFTKSLSSAHISENVWPEFVVEEQVIFHAIIVTRNLFSIWDPTLLRFAANIHECVPFSIKYNVNVELTN